MRAILGIEKKGMQDLVKDWFARATQQLEKEKIEMSMVNHGARKTRIPRMLNRLIM